MTEAAAPCTPLPDEGNTLSAILDAVTDGILIVDRTWCITWTNPVADRILARGTSANPVGHSLWEVYPELEHTPFAIAYRRAMAESMTVSVEARDPVTGRWHEARAYPSRQGLMIACRDVSDRVLRTAERETLLAAEASARESAERVANRVSVLQSLTAQLSTAVTPEQVVEVVVSSTIRSVGAVAASVALPKDGALHLVAHRGFDASLAEGYRVLEVDEDLPLARAFRTRQPEWLTTFASIAERYPAMAHDMERAGIVGAMVCLPLRIRDGAVGAANLAFASDRDFSIEEQNFIEAIAHQCAIAVDRAQIFARESEARAHAEAGEQRFRAIMQSPMMGLALTDLDGRILEANDAFLRMIDYDRVDLHRGVLDWRRITPPEFAEANERAAFDLRTRGYVAPFEKRYTRKDGTQVPALVASTRIEEQNVNATFVLDISERHRMLEIAQASARRSGFLAEASRILAGSLDYRATLDAIARLAVPTLADWCAVDMVAPDGSLERLAVTHSDPRKLQLAIETASRYPEDPNAPHGLYAVLRTGEAEWMHLIPTSVLESAAKDEEHLRVIRELGLRSYVCVPLIARGQVLGAISMVFAESGRHYDEADFQLAQELARQASMAVDNARLYAEAQEAIRLRDEFLSVASHELKTPLTPLQLRLQVLGRELGRTCSPKLEQHMEVAHRQVRKLASLVDGLLDVSRISAGKLHLDAAPVELCELVREIVSGHEHEAERMGSRIEIHTQGPVVGNWDRQRLEQVATNLVSNAIKYGAGKPIVIEIRAGNGQARLLVRDFGIGVAPEDAPRIFGRFERAVSGRNYGGLGLGLYITRRIVEAHGGRIWVESKQGEGSTFTVELPQG